MVGEIVKNLSERFGKILQQRQSISINRQGTSTFISTQLDSLIPTFKIANLSQDTLVGNVADNFGEEIGQKFSIHGLFSIVKRGGADPKIRVTRKTRYYISEELETKASYLCFSHKWALKS